MAEKLHWPTEPKVLELDRRVLNGDAYPMIQKYAEAVEADGVEVVVVEDKVHFNDGLQWAYQREIVKITRKDADVLAALGQVKILAA